LPQSIGFPAIYDYREFVEAGGLMSYGVDLADALRRLVGVADEVLRGKRPEDIPIAQPTKFELIVNQGTARTLGLQILATVLALRTSSSEVADTRSPSARPALSSLRDFPRFSHQGTANNQIATPQKATNQKTESQNSASSRLIVGCRVDGRLAAKCSARPADGLAELLHPVLLLLANELGFAAMLPRASPTRSGLAR
jgi:hypothetical protein